MIHTVPLAVIGRGFFKLNLILLPLSLIMLVYIGTMAGSAPNSPQPIVNILIVAAFIFLTPAALVLSHVAVAKIFDGVLRIAPPAKAEISWFGILFSAALIVVAGNIFVDDLYQFNKGNYGYSIFAFFLNVGGMVGVVTAGGGKVPLINRNLSAD
ncbi:hypothetical protein [Azospirillum sp. sgz301742]